MSEECTHNCSSCGKDCGERTAESLLVQPHSRSDVKHVIAVVSGKGGVGKSMITGLLAKHFTDMGKRTAILDADITGPSIPKMFGIKEKARNDFDGVYPVKAENGISVMSINLLLQNETDPVVWRGPVIANSVTQFWSEVIWGEVDYMFVDMPPGTGDVPLTVFQSLPIDGIVVVTSPQELVSMVVEKAVKMAQMCDVPILGIVENMSYFECPNCKERHYIYGESEIQAIAERYDIDMVLQLPLNREYASACDKGKAYEMDAKMMAPLYEKISK